MDIPNDVHAFQTAERIRQVYPELEWLQLVGLIHDIGKLMICYGEAQVNINKIIKVTRGVSGHIKLKLQYYLVIILYNIVISI